MINTNHPIPPERMFEFFALDGGGYCTRIRCDGYAPKELTLPCEYMGKAVTEIAERGIWHSAALTSVTIPDGYVKIGDGAFYDCPALVEISIPDGVTYIGRSAFAYCSSLASIRIPKSVNTVGDYAFRGCTSLIEVTIPDGVCVIDSRTFLECSSLERVKLPRSITDIGECVFLDCPSLKEVIFDGTKEEWISIEKNAKWKGNASGFKIICVKESEEQPRREHHSHGVCQYCGGEFTGLFKNKCSVCGRYRNN